MKQINTYGCFVYEIVFGIELDYTEEFFYSNGEVTERQVLDASGKLKERHIIDQIGRAHV